MHGALCGGPDALPLVHDDSPRDEAIAAFYLYVLQRLGVTVRSRAKMSAFFVSFICDAGLRAVAQGKQQSVLQQNKNRLNVFVYSVASMQRSPTLPAHHSPAGPSASMPGAGRRRRVWMSKDVSV